MAKLKNVGLSYMYKTAKLKNVELSYMYKTTKLKNVVASYMYKTTKLKNVVVLYVYKTARINNFEPSHVYKTNFTKHKQESPKILQGSINLDCQCITSSLTLLIHILNKNSSLFVSQLKYYLLTLLQN